MFLIFVLSWVVASTAHEHELTVPSAETADGPKFVFPDEGDAYFGQNVDALKASLSHALDSDCLTSWPPNTSVEIAIAFRHDGSVPETSQYYIQYQMEQVASLQTSEMGAGFRSFAHNMKYKMKLGGALQIWEWSPRHMLFLQKELPNMVSKRVKHVPLWSSVDADSSPSCVDILEQPACESYPGADVLFFGHLTKSRQHLCADVDAEMERIHSKGQLFSHECVSGVFGPALQCKICKAKVVYSDHSRIDSVLEVHRINPLLALGKAVISATSADTLLDTEYSEALELVPAMDIPAAISRLLLDDQARARLEWNAYTFAKKQKAQAQPALCRALNDLASAVERHEIPERNVGLESHVRYLAVRRLGTNGTNGTNGSNSSSTSVAVTTTATVVTSVASGTTTFVAGVSTTPASTTDVTESSSTSLAATTTATDATSLASGTEASAANVSTTSTSTATTSTVLLGGQCIGNDSRCRGSTQSRCTSLQRQGSDCVWQANIGGRSQLGKCFGNDSRCSGSGQARCARLSAQGSDCTWQRADGSPGTCLGNDSRCGGSDRSRCKYLVSQGTHCKWRASFSITGSLVASVSDAAAFVTSASAKSAVAQAIANISSVPFQYVDVDLSADTTRRRLGDTGARHLQSGRVLMAYGIDVPGDAPITLTATGNEVGALLASSETSEMTDAISSQLEETIGSPAFTVSVASVSSPMVIVEEGSAASTTLPTGLPTTSTPSSAGMTSSTPETSSTSAAFTSTTALAATMSSSFPTALSTTSGPASIPGTSSTLVAQPVKLSDRFDESKADTWRVVSPMCWALIIVALTRG